MTNDVLFPEDENIYQDLKSQKIKKVTKKKADAPFSWHKIPQVVGLWENAVRTMKGSLRQTGRKEWEAAEVAAEETRSPNLLAC